MIDKNLPEPPIEERYCVYCGKKKRLTGMLIHFPNENCEKEEIQLINGNMCPTFSMWTYKCAWCKAIDTKRKNRLRELLIDYPATTALVEAIGQI